jgi:hypothetical protein
MTKLSRKNNKISSKIFLHFIEPEINLEGFQFYDINKLNKIKDLSLEEIVIQDLLEYFSDMEFIDVLSKITNKLKPAGKLHIQGTDANSLCCGVAYSQIDIETFKILLFGAKKSNIFGLSHLKKHIENNLTNLSINKIKFINGLQYYIECVKNND